MWGEKEFEPGLEKLWVHRLPVMCDYTDTDVIVCSMPARLCSILSQISEREWLSKTAYFASYDLEHLLWVGLTHTSQESVFSNDSYFDVDSRNEAVRSWEYDVVWNI